MASIAATKHAIRFETPVLPDPPPLEPGTPEMPTIPPNPIGPPSGHAGPI